MNPPVRGAYDSIGHLQINQWQPDQMPFGPRASSIGFEGYTEEAQAAMAPPCGVGMPQWHPGVADATEEAAAAAAAAAEALQQQENNSALCPEDAALFGVPGTYPGDGDVRVSVVCGAIKGVLLLPKRRIIINAGTKGAREVSPTEFERLGGKGSAKKWRLSIRLRSGGRHIGEWLVQHGYDPSPASRLAAEKAQQEPAEEELWAQASGSDGGGGGGDCAFLPPGSVGQLVGAPSWEPLVRQPSLVFGSSTPPQHEADQANMLLMQQPQQHQWDDGGMPLPPPQQPQFQSPWPCPPALLQQQQPLQQHTSLLPPSGSSGPLGMLPRTPVTLHRLPGDGSDAVAAMADYLAGLAPTPPLHLLQAVDVPAVAGRELDLRALFNAVVQLGGYLAVTTAGRWGEVLTVLGIEERSDAGGGAAAVGEGAPGVRQVVHKAYVQLLLRFERMYDPEAWLLLTGRPSPMCIGQGSGNASPSSLTGVTPGYSPTGPAQPAPLGGDPSDSPFFSAHHRGVGPMAPCPPPGGFEARPSKKRSLAPASTAPPSAQGATGPPLGGSYSSGAPFGRTNSAPSHWHESNSQPLPLPHAAWLGPRHSADGQEGAHGAAQPSGRSFLRSSTMPAGLQYNAPSDDLGAFGAAAAHHCASEPDLGAPCLGGQQRQQRSGPACSLQSRPSHSPGSGPLEQQLQQQQQHALSSMPPPQSPPRRQQHRATTPDLGGFMQPPAARERTPGLLLAPCEDGDDPSQQPIGGRLGQALREDGGRPAGAARHLPAGGGDDDDDFHPFQQHQQRQQQLRRQLGGAAGAYDADAAAPMDHSHGPLLPGDSLKSLLPGDSIKSLMMCDSLKLGGSLKLEGSLSRLAPGDSLKNMDSLKNWLNSAFSEGAVDLDTLLEDLPSEELELAPPAQGPHGGGGGAQR